ncbi:subunit 1 of cleavage and polyadenylation specificity factor [Chloropicon primus]|uniref:DNA damage-binding protein 1 n=2 Tax=Chloropicon primus TaxID=1764295 RepID=A0A5B8MSL8_9CHLO|nr:subunit 1 of cleavage and polyadenylation specificity factor [Chloropicon primus]UPR02479.1 subunit 1 of cleavage and polyadenylation specificity factor [Chloropicon primus]|eukprot:QDZ23267.1 subunit 1 of cleavage and polyadenylation specificity factor [Chloropicon primus]
MSYAYYKEVFEPTCVRACASGAFTRCRKDLGTSSATAADSAREVFVLKGNNILELYQVVECELKGKKKLKFNLVRTVTMGGIVNAIETLRGRTKSQRDALVLLSESAQVSVIEYAPEAPDAVEDFRTTSLHSFADYDAVTLARNESRARKKLRCDPQGRLCAMMFYSDFVALIPTREHNLDELLQITDAVEVKKEEDSAPKRQKTSGANRFHKGTDVISLLEVCKVSYVKDICFLHGYNEPVLCLLHESSSSVSKGPTWPGRLRECKDTCGIKAFSINTTHRRYPKLMEKVNLPYDAFAVQGMPGVGGKCLVMCSDYILLLDHRTMNAVAVNKFGFSGFAKEIPLDRMAEPTGGDAMHTANVNQARKNAYLVIPEVVPQIQKIAQNETAMGMDLAGCKLAWLECFKNDGVNKAHGIMALQNGQLVLVTIKTDAMSMRGSSSSKLFDFKVCGSSSMPSCVSTLSENVLFLGSQLGSSVLLRCRMASSKSIKSSSSPNEEALPEDEGNVENDSSAPRNDGEGDDDNELEKELFASEMDVDLDTLSLTVCDRLSNLGPIQDMVNINTNPKKKEDIALAAAVGYGKHGGVAILSQNWRYESLLKIDLADIKFLRTVYSEEGDAKKSQGSAYHAYLVLSTSESTMILETKEELELVTEKVNFVTEHPTICVGNLKARERIAQVYKKGVRIMVGTKVAQDISCKEILSSTKLEGDPSDLEIKDACVCDPYVLVLLSNGTLGMLRGDGNSKGKVAEFGGKSRGDISCMNVVKNGCGYFGTQDSSDTHLCFMCDNLAGLEVVSLPSFTTVFKSTSVYQGYAKLSNANEAGMEATSPSVSVSQIHCQIDRLTRDLWVSLMISDGFLYVYKLDGNPVGGHHLTRVSVLNEFLLNSGSPSNVTRRMMRLENVGKHNGYFVTGDKPFVVFLSQGQVRVYSAFRDGPITSITPFHNVNCNHGFVFATESGQLNVCNFNDRVSSTLSWWAEVKTVGATVHKITYSAETGVIAALVSKGIPYRKRKPEEGGGDAHATNVYAAQEAAVAARDKEEAFEVQLISAETLEVLWSHTLGPAEVGMSISSVYVKNQTDQSVSSIIAVGTATPRGEDYPCRGNVHLFKIEKQDIPNVELGQPSVKWGASLVTSKDFRGSPGGGGVHVVTCLDGYLLVGIGIKVLLFKWNGQYPPETPPGYPKIPQLEQCGFFDSTLFASSLATVKKFVLSGDSMRGIHFLRWLDAGNDSRKVLQLLSHDYDKPPIHHVQFLIDGSTLAIMGVDMHGNIRMYAFDPKDPDSLKGKKLLSRAVFYSGGRVSGVTRMTAKASSNSPAMTVSHRIGVCLSTYDASLGMLFPLDETTFKRLRSLQDRLVSSMVQVAGLNPLRFRHAKNVEAGRGQSSDKVLDGQTIWKFLHLSIEEQNKVAKLIGSRRETVLNSLRSLAVGMGVY